MIPYKQLYKHRPDLGTYGDCHRTVIASLLEVPQESIPNFGIHYDSYVDFEAAERKYLLSQGLVAMSVAYAGDLKNVLAAISSQQPNLHFILGGLSERGIEHSVIACNGVIVMDPVIGGPDENALTGPCKDGYWWVTHLISTKFVKADI